MSWTVAGASPRLGVGMPVYQGEGYIAETLRSILEQDFADFELIISDNASSDGTEEICREFQRHDSRIRYLRNTENLGAARNYNRVFHASRGEYFKWASYDDVLLGGYLRRCVEVLDSGPPSVALCYPRTTIIDGQGNEVRHHRDDFEIRGSDPARRVAQFARQWGMCNPCFGLHRRSVLSTTRLIQPYISSDVTLLGELALRGEFVEIPERLFLRRIHSTSSRHGDVSLADVASWFDPGRRPGKLHPRTRILLEMHRSILESDLAWPSKLRCQAALTASWVHRRSRVRAGNLRQRLTA